MNRAGWTGPEAGRPDRRTYMVGASRACTRRSNLPTDMGETLHKGASTVVRGLTPTKTLTEGVITLDFDHGANWSQIWFSGRMDMRLEPDRQYRRHLIVGLRSTTEVPPDPLAHMDRNELHRA